MKKITTIVTVICFVQIIIAFKPLKLVDVHPVIFIPGDGGSQVEAKLNKPSVVHYICDKTSDYFSLWLNIELLVPVVIDCWVDNIKLIYDNNTRRTRNNDGVDIRIPGWGRSEPVEWIDPSHASNGAYFKYIGDVLVGMGYERDKSLRGAPYDFRRGPNENEAYFTDLKRLIEETYELNDQRSVILMAHSMGAPYSLIMLQRQTQAWKDKYINSLVTIAGAWAGSMKAVKVFAMGDDLGSFMLRQNVLRAQQITAPSTAFLLPNKYFWHSTEVLVQSRTRNYTIDDMEKFFHDIGYPVGWEMYKDVQPYTLNYTAPGVEVHCLHGFDVDTVEKLIYKSEDWINETPKLSSGDGDGTVNRRSLEGCLVWQGKQPQKVYHLPVAGEDHLAILKSPLVLEYIAQLAIKIHKRKK